MLASCVHNQWPLETYQHYDHPLQVAIRREIASAAGLEDEGALMPHGVDGCGVPTYVLPLHSMARMQGCASIACVASPLTARTQVCQDRCR